ncbi:MAG: TonB-dependent receptor [Bacteroidales bacterium]
MKTVVQLLILLLFGCKFSDAQITLHGRVTDYKGQTLPGANVMLKGTYDGASDTGGCFLFKTREMGKQILMVSFIGYKTAEREIDLSAAPMPIEVVLEEQSGEIKGVIITAGAFETGELKRAIVLKPMDIATTPSAMGDIYGALTTLPGAQVVGNEGGLYVRGGEGYETKTFIDGMQVANPYISKMPDLLPAAGSHPFFLPELHSAQEDIPRNTDSLYLPQLISTLRA